MAHMYAHASLKHAFPTQVEWTLRVDEAPPTGCWFWAVHLVAAARYQGEQVGMYAGLQLVDGEHAAIFSVWSAKDARCSAPFTATHLDEDGPAWRILGPFNWRIGADYRFRLHVNSRHLWVELDSADSTPIMLGDQDLPEGWFVEGFARTVNCFAEWFGNTPPTTPMRATIGGMSPLHDDTFVAGNSTLGVKAEVSNGMVVFSLP